ncbi:WUSCHEL-related homeobox 9 [Senna tora]|uniref:WUSCHEL-related homeobox 9 n=1 Tax=Senna tora TaxID=362788 RepID=A0A834X7K4_9FABA|nr:WUSCHEL-related homeobox 9 [Senna tora]
MNGGRRMISDTETKMWVWVLVLVVHYFHAFFLFLRFLYNSMLVHHLTKQETSARPNILLMIMMMRLSMNHIRELREAKPLSHSSSSTIIIMVHWEEERVIMIRVKIGVVVVIDRSTLEVAKLVLASGLAVLEPVEDIGITHLTILLKLSSDLPYLIPWRVHHS